MDFRTFGLLACAMAAAAIVARIVWLMANRIPVLAHSANTDALGETAADDPLNPHVRRHGLGALSPVNSTDMRVDYVVNGKTYEHDLERHSIEGLEITAPDDMPILWANSDNPAQVEAHGPGFWVAMLLLVGLAAGALFDLHP